MKAYYKRKFLGGTILKKVEREWRMNQGKVTRQLSELKRDEKLVGYLLNMDRRLTAADTLGVNKMVAHKIIEGNLGITKIYVKLVPKVLTEEQKQTSFGMC